MAICTSCNQEMLEVDGCTRTIVEFQYDTILPSIRYGDETRFYRPESHDRCGDCNVAVGQYHHSGCDIEECPQCHRQLLSCDCWNRRLQLTK